MNKNQVQDNYVEQYKTNYLNTILKLSETFDPIINQLQNSYPDGKISSWRQEWLLKPAKDMVKLKDVFKGLHNLNISIIPWISSVSIPILSDYLLNLQIPTWGTIGFALGTFVTSYFMLLPSYKKKMYNIADKEHFHIGAYKKYKPEEYALFKRSILFKDFSFNDLYHFSLKLFTAQKQESDGIKHVVDQFKLEKEYLLEQIDSLKQELINKDEVTNNVLDELEFFTAEVQREQEKDRRAIRFLIELIKDTNTVLYRMTNNKIKSSDLRIISGFTIYEHVREQNILKKIADEFTSGGSQDIIEVTKENETLAAVKILNDHESIAAYNNPRPGYTIVAFRMRMKQDKIWVFNFHFDEVFNEKALLLTLSDDIIETKEVFRLVHALCLQLQDRGFPKEGIDYNEPAAQ